jgi:Uma2 family endonuclease
MSTVPHYQPIPVRDYLCGEARATRKHEYVDGFVYAMVGATNAHNRIATNATVALGAQLHGKVCQVCNSDTKIRIRSARGTRFYYPDLSVVCHPNPPDDTFHDAPVLVVEVLSKWTCRIDEYEKREAYLSIDSLGVYILVEQSTAAAMVYRRGDSGFDRESYVGLSGCIPLPEIECELSLASLYEQVEFPSAENDDELPA